MNIPEFAKNAIIVIAVLAILWVFITWAGIPIPQPIVYGIVIVIVAVILIWLVRFLQVQ